MLNAEPLNEKSFTPYGAILKRPGRNADGIGEFHEYWDGLQVFSGETSVNYLVTKAREMVMTQMERHVKTPEILVLLDGPCLLPVAPAGEFDGNKMKVFQMNPGEAVCLNSGAWHWIPFPLDGYSRFLVIYRHGTPGDDLEFVPLNGRVAIGI